MRNMDKNMKSVTAFLGLSYGVAWLAILIAYIAGLRYGMENMTVLLSALLFVPGLASLAVRKFIDNDFKNMRIKPNFRHNIFKYVTAYFLPAICVLCGAMLFFFINPDAMDINATNTAQSLAESYSVDFETGRGIFYGQILISIAVAPLANILFAAGEALGWQGYLLPKLCNKFGTVKAMLISGVLWGVWYAPMIALGQNYGTDYFLYPITGIVLMILFCVSVGSIMSYFTLRVGSIIPAVLIGSAVKGLASIGIYFVNSDATTLSEMLLVGPSAMGIAGMSIFILAGLMYLVRSRRLKWSADEEAITEIKR